MPIYDADGGFTGSDSAGDPPTQQGGGSDWFDANSPQSPGATAPVPVPPPYYGPMAPGVTPRQGEGDATHNPNFYGPGGPPTLGGGGGGRQYTDREKRWLAENPGDEGRMAEALGSDNFGDQGQGQDSDPWGRGKGWGGYHAPNFRPSPFVTPDGRIPPGMPYSPNAELQGAQDKILQSILTQPAISPDYVNRVNEQQKELILNRGQAATRASQQGLANRGVYAGGQQQAAQHRIGQDVTTNLLQSQRDISNQAELANREGFINALSSSEGILGGREGRGLDYARFIEAIRQYDQDLQNRQSEFGAGLDYNYAGLNSNLEQQFINSLLRGGG